MEPALLAVNRLANDRFGPFGQPTQGWGGYQQQIAPTDIEMTYAAPWQFESGDRNAPASAASSSAGPILGNNRGNLGALLACLETADC